MMNPIRSYPIETDWDELFFMAHELLGLSMDEFLYDYNQALITDMINRKIEFKYGVNPSEEKEPEPETVEARDLFSELGF